MLITCCPGLVETRRGPAAGPLADVAGDALGPGHGDELGDAAVTFPLAMHRAGQHDQAGANASVCGGECGLHVGDAGGKADNDEPFPLHAAAALSDLQKRAAKLDSRSRLTA